LKEERKLEVHKELEELKRKEESKRVDGKTAEE
jgi:hypothetical protein